jgi:hypothetical protein
MYQFFLNEGVTFSIDGNAEFLAGFSLGTADGLSFTGVPTGALPAGSWLATESIPFTVTYSGTEDTAFTPEPGTLGLLLIGLAVLMPMGASRPIRRRKRPQRLQQ